MRHARLLAAAAAAHLGQDVVHVGHHAAAVAQRIPLPHPPLHQRGVRRVVGGGAEVGGREGGLGGRHADFIPR
jgi:hypothetical protein